MSETPSAPNREIFWENPDFQRRLRRRKFAEKRFQAYGIGAVLLGLVFVAMLIVSITANGVRAFWQTQIHLEIHFDEQEIDANAPTKANYRKLVRQAMYNEFPEVTSRKDKRQLAGMLSIGADTWLMKMVQDKPDIIGTRQRVWLPLDDNFDMLRKGVINRDALNDTSKISPKHLHWFDTLVEKGMIELKFNTQYFLVGDSREPELAGLRGALTGSFYTLLVTFLLSFPIGVAAACYLEEFAPKNRFTDIIEININNLAAVPSVVFGLLGLAIFINFFSLPRSVPLVGGLVLTLMTIPTIIISGRAALRAVPPSIREGAMAIGASRMQVVLQHVVPLALPGMLTGTIIGLAQALGETAPLLMIGMVAFIVDVPSGPLDPSTVLPVQIFLWADSPERALVEKASGAILILMSFLIVMNAAAVMLRNKFERRW